MTMKASPNCSRREKRGSPHELSNLIDTLMQLIKAGNIKPLDHSLNLMDLAGDFLKEYKLKSYPPIHHSKLYSKQNPPYLVVPPAAMKQTTIHPNCH